jgi:putative endonuclease
LGDGRLSEQFYVYVMASGRNGTIYIGSTNDLVRRAWEHRNGVVEGFTKKYDCRLLVWYEVHGDLESARARELQMKAWKRAWKVREVEGLNPGWEDLCERIAQP